MIHVICTCLSTLDNTPPIGRFHKFIGVLYRNLFRIVLNLYLEPKRDYILKSQEYIIPKLY